MSLLTGSGSAIRGWHLFFYPDRISFIDALRWLLWATAGDPIPTLVVNPLRKDRHEPRVIKDLQDTYPKMKQPRAELRKELKKQGKILK